MIYANTIELFAETRPTLQTWTPTPDPTPVQPTVVVHRDPSPIATIVVALGFVCIFVGVIMLTARLERAEKNRSHAPAQKTLYMAVMR